MMASGNGGLTVDLRSDTVTHPTPQMREAMLNAELGDDVLGDDPTVKRLEAMAAERLGKEAALFVSSGTMANLVSLLTHCQHGDEAIVGSMAHVLRSEVDGASALGGIQLRTARNDENGLFELEEVRSLLRGPEPFQPRTALICLENTHNAANGSPISAAFTTEVAEIAHNAGAALHIDGARIFNAAIALETSAESLVRHADSVSFCLSKGLACPVGSMICGSTAFIERARHMRRMVGGAMRQVGVIAAAGIVALDEMVDRLAEDHANARMLAEGLASIPGISANPELVRTNIIFFEIESQDVSRFRAGLTERGVLFSGGPKRFRMVTHYGVDANDIDYALQAVREVVASGS